MRVKNFVGERKSVAGARMQIAWEKLGREHLSPRIYYLLLASVFLVFVFPLSLRKERLRSVPFHKNLISHS